MSLLSSASLFHVGVVAKDIDVAMAAFTKELGVHWKGGYPLKMDVCVYGKPLSLEMRIAHTIEGEPHIELIQAIADTPWQVTRGREWHHLCYWSEEASELCQSLLDKGYARVLGFPGEDSGYFQAPDGLLIEIINAKLYRDLSGWLSKSNK